MNMHTRGSRLHVVNRIRALWIFLLTAAVAGSLPAQTIEPDEPELVLPRLLLEINDLTVESVQTILPDQSRPEVPKLELTLPEEEEMYVPDSAFELGLPGQSVPGIPAMERASSVFSDGMIGIGSMNHILGSISIYKLGSEPRFSLQFSHEGTDGFSGENAGTGFSGREEQLNGSLNLRHQDLQTDSEASYREEEFGLQKKSERYNSVMHRFVRTGSLFRFQPSEIFSMKGSFSAGIANMILSTRNAGEADPNAFSEILVSPDVEATLSYTDFSLGFSGKYGYSGIAGMENSDIHRGLVSGSFDIDFSIPLYLEGSLGVYWNSGRELLFPFNLGLSSRYRDVLSIFVKGGYTVEEQSYTDLWNEIPFVKVSPTDSAIRDAHGFFIESGFSWLAMNGITVEGSLGFSSLEDTISVGIDRYDPDTGLFPFEQRLAMRLNPSFGLTWQWRDMLSLVLNYTGDLFADRPEQAPAHRLGLSADMGTPSGRFGGSASLAMDIFNNVAAPELDFGGFFRISDGVRFILEAEDIFEPFMSDGRRYFGDSPYVSPGFHLTLKTQISL